MMNKEEIDTMFQALIEKSGHWPQIEMLTEEMGEFLQAINKLKRTKQVNDKIIYPSAICTVNYSLKYFAVCSELADLEILLMQMRNIFCSEAIDIAKERKLQRQKKRVFTDNI